MMQPIDFSMHWFVIRSTARTIENAGTLLRTGVFQVSEIPSLHMTAVRLFAACNSIALSAEDETLERNAAVLAKLADSLLEDTRDNYVIPETLRGNIEGFISTLNSLYPEIMRGEVPTTS